MAVSKLNPVSGGKTMFCTTLTSGTSYTVPAGVTYLNVTLMGGGGGASGKNSPATYDSQLGQGGQIISSTLSATAGGSIAYAIGAGGAGGTSGNPATSGSAGGTTTFTGATSAVGGAGGTSATTGAVGTAASYATNGGGITGIGNANGGTGGAGAIYVEYWA